METFDDAIEAIYSAAFDGDGWAAAIDRVCVVVGSNGLIVNPVRLDRSGVLLFSNHLQGAIAEYERDWRQRDPRIQAGLVQGLSRGVVTDRVLGITAADRARHPYYQEFLRPLGMECFAAYLFRTVDGQIYSVTAQRQAGDGEFGDGDLAAIARLGRHMVRALDLAPRAVRAMAHAGSLVDGFERLGHGLMTIDLHGRVEPLNAAAERLMAAGFRGLGRGGHGRAGPIGDPVFDRFVAAVRHRLVGGPAVEPVVSDRPGGARLMLQVLPAAPIEGAAAPMRGAMCAVVSIYDLGPRRSATVRGVLMRDGLTAGEARVAEELGAGGSPRDAAVALGLSEGTVRHVLKVIFGKLGLRRQGELVARITRLQAACPDTAGEAEGGTASSPRRGNPS